MAKHSLLLEIELNSNAKKVEVNSRLEIKSSQENCFDFYYENELIGFSNDIRAEFDNYDYLYEMLNCEEKEYKFDVVITKISRLKAVVAISFITCCSYDDFEISDDGTLNKYFGNGIDVNIPENIMRIGVNTFKNVRNFISVFIPDSVIKIERESFSSSGVINVQFGSGLVTIGKSAFYSCFSLQSIAIPDSVETIENQAFANCVSLKNVSFGQRLKNIGSEAFADCRALEGVVLPKNVIRIENGAFNGQKEITLYDRVEGDINSIVTKNNHVINVLSYETNEIKSCVFIPKSLAKMNKTIWQGTELNCVEYDERIFLLKSLDEKLTAALFRLTNPQKLSDEYKAQYASYIGKNVRKAVRVILDTGNMAGLMYICNKGLLSVEEVDFAICETLKLKADGMVKFLEEFKSNQKKEDSQSTHCELCTNGKSQSEIKRTWKYKEIDNSTIMVCGYKGLDSIIYIPSEIMNRRVTEIGNFSRNNWKSFECYNPIEIVIPNNVLVIRERAFGYIKDLEKILIPDSVLRIEDRVFLYCFALKYLTIGKGLEEIGVEVFRGCINLISIEVHNENQMFSSDAGILYNKDKTELLFCPAGKSGALKIPDCVKKIANCAFDNCIELTSVILPNNMLAVGDYAFGHCCKLACINFPDNVKKMGERVFCFCENLTTIIIPEGVTSIGDGSFSSCLKLKSIDIPSTVSSIGKEAFQNCKQLLNVNLPDGLETIDDCAFQSCEKLESITIKKYLVNIGDDVFSGCNCLDNIDVSSENLVFTSNDGFLYEGEKMELIWCATRLKECLHIPYGIKRIRDYAMKKCIGVKNINIPDSVVSIGNGAFMHCCDLTSITIPDSVVSIGNGAFMQCYNLTSITIPDSVIKIGNSVFSDCSSLVDIKISKSISCIGSNSFHRCEKLENIKIPSNVTSIAADAFHCCFSLNYIDVDINNTVYSSREGILYTKDMSEVLLCPADKTGSVIIPNSIVHICDRAFYNCSKLECIVIPDSLKSIGFHAFWKCRNLISIEIPDSVNDIDNEAFENCNVIIRCKKASYAEKYAKKKNLQIILI